MLKTHDFYYDLPEELIAQTPLERRDGSRLMVLNKDTGEIEHRHFYDLPEYLQPGDTLVLNDSRVLPARLLGHRVPTMGAVEVLLLRDKGDGVWECLTKPGRKTHTGTELSFGDGELTATVVGEVDDGNKLVQFHYKGIFLEVLERLGQMPLPPYIHEQLQDPERYQTVYSRANGSAAAPTAGLHFTKELLEKLQKQGVNLAYVTLHVGLGTFRPVKAEEITDHHMHSEFCMMSAETAKLLNETHQSGHRIVCVGTTSCRTVESLVEPDGTFREKSAWTEIFIYPGYTPRCFFVNNKTIQTFFASGTRFSFMLHLYALFAEYIHILCIFTVYIRGTCIPPGACADYSTRKEFTPQKQKARDPFVSRLALKESRVSFSLYAPENGPPAALHARHSSSFWALGSCLRAYSRRRAARLSAHSSR